MSQIEQMDSPYPTRQAELVKTFLSNGLDCIALNPGPSLTYLTGLTFHLMERPVVALFLPSQPPVFVLPKLEMAKLEGLPFEAQSFAFSDDPAEWPSIYAQAFQEVGLDGRKVGVEPTRMRYLELRLMERAAPKAQFFSGAEILSSMRMRKDEQEVSAMRTAAAIAQEALEATLPMIKTGITEREIASELTLQLLRAGSEPELPFFPIVSGGPNSANPHAAPSDRPLQKGDLLVIDWGAAYHGYISDITRTFAIGALEAEFQHIASIVLQANAAGRSAARPTVSAGEVDRAAREVIEKAGYGPYFFHRTGHGIGMEGHEEPYIREGSSLELQPGMAFTVEPGIYLPGRGGVRIEDNVVISPDGAECLTDLPRQLRVLG